MNKRDKKIKQLRLDKGLTYKEIGKKFDISPERVRQICNSKEDKQFIIDEIKVNYKKKFNDVVTLEGLIKDIKELAKKDRRKITVIKRRILVQFLYEELNLPFYRIGDLLERDHTSIMYLYYERD